jgi:hypothetical protein
MKILLRNRHDYVCDEHALYHVMAVNAYARVMNANTAISIDKQEHSSIYIYIYIYKGKSVSSKKENALVCQCMLCMHILLERNKLLLLLLPRCCCLDLEFSSLLVPSRFFSLPEFLSLYSTIVYVACCLFFFFLFSSFLTRLHLIISREGCSFAEKKSILFFSR